MNVDTHTVACVLDPVVDVARVIALLNARPWVVHVAHNESEHVIAAVRAASKEHARALVGCVVNGVVGELEGVGAGLENQEEGGGR